MYTEGDRIFIYSRWEGIYTGEIIKAGKPGFAGQFLYVRLDVPRWIQNPEGCRSYWQKTTTFHAKRENLLMAGHRVRLLSRKQSV
jgi:hypothetical protein